SSLPRSTGRQSRASDQLITPVPRSLGRTGSGRCSGAWQPELLARRGVEAPAQVLLGQPLVDVFLCRIEAFGERCRFVIDPFPEMVEELPDQLFADLVIGLAAEDIGRNRRLFLLRSGIGVGNRLDGLFRFDAAHRRSFGLNWLRSRRRRLNTR